MIPLPTPNHPALLDLRALRIAFEGGARPVLHGIDFTLGRGEVRALVGESGSGKTLLARSLVGLLPTGATLDASTARFDGHDLLDRQQDIPARLRGREIGFIFQEPLSSLNPTLRIETQLAEGLAVQSGRSIAACREEALAMLRRVRIRDPESCLARYPHELSGGMRQRVMIAASLITRPALLIADEPTTALDLLVQDEVLSIMRGTARELGTAILLITHDLSVVAEFADSVTVLERGHVVEEGPVSAIFQRPRRPYTRKLLDAVFRPASADTQHRPTRAAPLLEIRDLRLDVARRQGGERVTILDRVGFELHANETLAVIGESGSGKTSLSRVVAGLQAATSGEIRFQGAPLGDLRARRGQIQLIFQDPFGALDPRMTIGATIAEGLVLDRELPAAARRAKVERALTQVGLDPGFAHRLPHQLSGGQRQRVAIARAIVVEPALMIADEPVSALDLTIQRQILDLFLQLQREMGFGCLFVSHDLGVVEQLADRICVLCRGRVVEIGPRAALFDAPRHPYTRRLIAATPLLTRDESGAYRKEPRRLASPAEGLPFLDVEFAAAESASGFRYHEVAPGHLVAIAA